MILHTQTQGSGFPIVFIHGFCEDLTVWAPVISGLERSYRVICLDLPGFGKSPLPASAPSIDDYAAAVADTLDSLGVKDCLILGHSLGGYVSLAFARHHATRVKGLGMVHSTAFADDEAKKENRKKLASFVREHGNKAFLSTFFPSLFADQNKEAFSSVIEQLNEAGKSIDPEAIAQAALAMADRQDGTDVLASLDVPVLYLIGKQDMIPFERSMAQCLIAKNAVVHAWEGVGHIGMQEAPEAMKKAIAGFISYCVG